MAIVNKSTKILLLLTLCSSAAFATSDCGGKPFLCVNSTHFNICVDFGNGVSYTVDNFIIGCPSGTECSGRNQFECEIPTPTIPGAIDSTSDATNDGTAKGERSVSTTPMWEVVTTNVPLSSVHDAEFSEKYLNTNSLDASAISTKSDPATAVPTESIVFSEITTSSSVLITADKDNPSPDIVTSSAEPFSLQTTFDKYTGPVYYTVTSATTTEDISSTVQPIIQSDTTTSKSVNINDVTTPLVPEATPRSDKPLSKTTVTDSRAADFSEPSLSTESAIIYDNLLNASESATKEIIHTTTETITTDIQPVTEETIQEMSLEPTAIVSQSPLEWTDSSLVTKAKVLTSIPSSEQHILTTFEPQTSSVLNDWGISTLNPPTNIEEASNLGGPVTTLPAETDLATRPSFTTLDTTINPPAQTGVDWGADNATESYTIGAATNINNTVVVQDTRTETEAALEYYDSTPPFVVEITTEKVEIESKTMSPDFVITTVKSEQKETSINNPSTSAADIKAEATERYASEVETIHIDTDVAQELKPENDIVLEHYNTLQSQSVEITTENVEIEKQRTPVFVIETETSQHMETTTYTTSNSVTYVSFDKTTEKYFSEIPTYIDGALVTEERTTERSLETESYDTSKTLFSVNTINPSQTKPVTDANIATETYIKEADANIINAVATQESTSDTDAPLKRYDKTQPMEVEIITEKIRTENDKRIKKELPINTPPKAVTDWKAHIATEGYSEVETSSINAATGQDPRSETNEALEHYDTTRSFAVKITADKVEIENQSTAVFPITTENILLKENNNQSNSIADFNSYIATESYTNKADTYTSDAIFQEQVTATRPATKSTEILQSLAFESSTEKDKIQQQTITPNFITTTENTQPMETTINTPSQSESGWKVNTATEHYASGADQTTSNPTTAVKPEATTEISAATESTTTINNFYKTVTGSNAVNPLAQLSTDSKTDMEMVYTVEFNKINAVATQELIPKISTALENYETFPLADEITTEKVDLHKPTTMPVYKITTENIQEMENTSNTPSKSVSDWNDHTATESYAKGTVNNTEDLTTVVNSEPRSSAPPHTYDITQPLAAIITENSQTDKKTVTPAYKITTGKPKQNFNTETVSVGETTLQNPLASIIFNQGQTSLPAIVQTITEKEAIQEIPTSESVSDSQGITAANTIRIEQQGIHATTVTSPALSTQSDHLSTTERFGGTAKEFITSTAGYNVNVPITKTAINELTPSKSTTVPETIVSENYGVVESGLSTIILHPLTVKERFQTALSTMSGKEITVTVSTENYGLVESVLGTIILHPSTVQERLQTAPSTLSGKADIATLEKPESEKDTEENSKIDVVPKSVADNAKAESITENPITAGVKTQIVVTPEVIKTKINFTNSVTDIADTPEVTPKADTTSAKPPVKTTPAKPSVKASSALAPELNCTNLPRGRYSDDHDCRKFYICVNKPHPIVGHCPVNTVFSEIKRQCVRNFSHCVRGNEFKCAAQGRFVDYNIDNIYYICVRRGSIFLRFKFQCQTGYSLDRTAVKCVQNLSSENDSVSLSDSVKRPERSQTIKSGTSSITTKKPSKDSGSGEKEFSCKTAGNFPHASDCRKYYICNKTKKSELKRKVGKCDSDEVFNQDKKKCVDADSYECQL